MSIYTPSALNTSENDSAPQLMDTLVDAAGLCNFLSSGLEELSNTIDSNSSWDSHYGKASEFFDTIHAWSISFAKAISELRDNKNLETSVIVSKIGPLQRDLGLISNVNSNLFKVIIELSNSKYKPITESYNQKTEGLKNKFNKIIENLNNAKVLIDNLSSIRSHFNPMNNRWSKTETSFTGVDIKAVYSARGEYIELGDLSVISISTFREKVPVRTLGHVNPKGYCRGSRSIAGTMVFATFNEDAFTEAFKSYGREKREYESMTPLVDQLPPFEVILTFRNEHGATAVRRIYGVELQSDGETYSIDDMMIERTINYIARDSDPLKRGVYGSEGYSTQHETYADSIRGIAPMSLEAAKTIALKERAAQTASGSANDSPYDYSPTGLGSEDVSRLSGLTMQQAAAEAFSKRISQEISDAQAERDRIQARCTEAIRTAKDEVYAGRMSEETFKETLREQQAISDYAAGQYASVARQLEQDRSIFAEGSTSNLENKKYYASSSKVETRFRPKID